MSDSPATPTPDDDDEAGMLWWNNISVSARLEWMAKAGNTGRPVDAWNAYKREDTTRARPGHAISATED